MKTTYEQEKRNALANLREFSEDFIKANCQDVPMCCEAINDHADSLQKSLPYSLEDDEREKIGRALATLAGDLQPDEQREAKARKERNGIERAFKTGRTKAALEILQAARSNPPEGIKTAFKIAHGIDRG